MTLDILFLANHSMGGVSQCSMSFVNSLRKNKNQIKIIEKHLL